MAVPEVNPTHGTPHMKTLIEIGGTHLYIEQDPTIPADTIRVSSLDKFVTMLSRLEDCTGLGSSTAPATIDPSRVRTGKGSKSMLATREEVQEAVKRMGTSHLDKDEKAVIQLRYGPTRMQTIEVATRLDIPEWTVTRVTKTALVKLGIEPKVIKRTSYKKSK